MSVSISNAQGLPSGIQWQDLITQIVAAEQARLLTPVTNASTDAENASSAWTNFQTLVNTFRDAAAALRDELVGRRPASKREKVAVQE